MKVDIIQEEVAAYANLAGSMFVTSEQIGYLFSHFFLPHPNGFLHVS